MEAKQNKDIFPFDIQDLDPDTSNAVNGHYQYGLDFVSVGPKNYILLKPYMNIASTLYNAQTRADQIFVAGLPRSGTTWTQRVIWLINNDLDYDASDALPMDQDFTFLEAQFRYQKLYSELCEDSKLGEEKMKMFKFFCQPLELKLQNHNMLKTHIPLSLLPSKLLETSKMVYVARDPREVMVSCYHLAINMYNSYQKDLKTYCKYVVQGKVQYSPYFEHVKEAWEQRHSPNLLFLFYQDLLNDRLTTLRRVANFFNKSYTDEQLSGLANYLDFKNLQDKKTYNLDCLKDIGIFKPETQFVRVGKSGGWRQHFDEEMSRETEQWIADNLRGTDLRFPSMCLEKFN